MRRPALEALRALGLVAVGIPACVGQPPPAPGSETSTGAVEPTAGSTLVADASTGAPESSTTTETGTQPSTSTDSDWSTSTGPGCTPGAEGCSCNEGSCNGRLACIEDTCVALLCGNGDIDAGEDCDDGNRIDSDGCDDDCTVSTGAAQVIAGDEHACALFHTGDIKCWGNATTGRLGYLGQLEDVGDDETPADMPFVNIGAPVIQLALGSDFTCVLLDTQEIKCWGSGADGRLGQGNTTDLGFAQEPADIPPINFGVDVPVQIAAGQHHVCAVMLTGELHCWGRNDTGQVGIPFEIAVGDNEVPGNVPPVNLGAGVVVEQVAAGSNHTCALLGRGGVMCFGLDLVGQLGTPGIDDTIGDDEHPAEVPAAVLLPEAAVVIAGRFNHTCVAYDTGTIQCWGDGGAGRLGYGNTDNVGDDEDVSLIPPVDPVGAEPTHFGMGSAHTCVRLATTQIYCWGEGSTGQLGYGNTMDLLAPSMDQVHLALPLAPRMVTAGREFSCATTEGSQVKCWGRNNRGQLGYGIAWNTNLADNEPIDSTGAVPIE